MPRLLRCLILNFKTCHACSCVRRGDVLAIANITARIMSLAFTKIPLRKIEMSIILAGILEGILEPFVYYITHDFSSFDVIASLCYCFLVFCIQEFSVSNVIYFS